MRRVWPNLQRKGRGRCPPGDCEEGQRFGLLDSSRIRTTRMVLLNESKLCWTISYAVIQGSKPQTLAFGLTDSPAGLAAWIAEKFFEWTDHPGTDVLQAVSKDRLLTNIMLYWCTGAIRSSFSPYYVRHNRGWPLPDGATVTAPTSYVQFPKEILLPPRSIAEKVYTNIQRWTEMQAGGHFAALEQPRTLATEVQEFFRGRI